MQKKPIIFIVFLMLIEFVSFANSFGQNLSEKNVFYVNGANSDFLLNHLHYWKSDNQLNPIDDADKQFQSKNFKIWKATNALNLKKLETDLWIHLYVKNLSKKDKVYWWGIYTQSETILVYEKQMQH